MSHSSEGELKDCWDIKLTAKQGISKTDHFSTEKIQGNFKKVSACGCLHPPFEINRPALKALSISCFLFFLSLLTKVGPKLLFYVPSQAEPEATFAVWITCSTTVQK